MAEEDTKIAGWRGEMDAAIDEGERSEEKEMSVIFLLTSFIAASLLHPHLLQK